MTNGAFYGHFESKAAAFREVAIQGLVELREGVERYRAEYGANWLAAFTRFYFSESKVGCAENACALPSFAPARVRASEATRAGFEQELPGVALAVAEGLPDGAPPARLDRAWAILALWSGGVMLARSVNDDATREGLIAALAGAILANDGGWMPADT